MCYSAEAWSLYDNYAREFGADIDIKAFWEIYLERDFEVQGNQFTSYVREVWELADGGKVLKIKRTVNLLAGWDETTLVFNRESAKP